VPEDPGRFDGPDRFDSSSPSSSLAASLRPDDPRLEAALNQLRVLSGALAASVLVYAGVAWYMTSGVGGAPAEPVELPGIAVVFLAFLAVFDLVIAPVIERALSAGGGGGQDLDSAVATYRRAKLVGFAFREAAAVLGLLIGLFTGNPSWCYALVAATLVAMALAWPSRDGLLRVAGGSLQPE